MERVAIVSMENAGSVIAATSPTKRQSDRVAVGRDGQTRKHILVGRCCGRMYERIVVAQVALIVVAQVAL